MSKRRDRKVVAAALRAVARQHKAWRRKVRAVQKVLAS